MVLPWLWIYLFCTASMVAVICAFLFGKAAAFHSWPMIDAGIAWFKVNYTHRYHVERLRVLGHLAHGISDWAWRAYGQSLVSGISLDAIKDQA